MTSDLSDLYPYFLVHSTAELGAVPDILENGLRLRTLGKARNTYPVFTSVLLPNLELPEIRWYHPGIAFVLDPAVLKSFPFKIYGHMGAGKRACVVDDHTGEASLLMTGEGDLQALPDLGVLETHLAKAISTTQAAYWKSQRFTDGHELVFCQPVPPEHILAILVRNSADARAIQQHLQANGAGHIHVIRVHDPSPPTYITPEGTTTSGARATYESILNALDSGPPRKVDDLPVTPIERTPFDPHAEDRDDSDSDESDNDGDIQAGAGPRPSMVWTIGLACTTALMAIVSSITYV